MDPDLRLERHRDYLRERRGPGIRALNERPWYIKAKDHRSNYITMEWNQGCTHCGIVLLEGESNGWCCNQGRKILPQLPPYPAVLIPIIEVPNISTISLKLNKLFTFSVTGVANGQWHHPPGQSTVVLGGRTYHRVLPTQRNGHPIHWFLYDDHERADNARQSAIPQHIVDFVTHGLLQCNPFIAQFRRWHEAAPPGVALELIGKMLEHHAYKEI